jgi:hypothetical protein
MKGLIQRVAGYDAPQLSAFWPSGCSKEKTEENTGLPANTRDRTESESAARERVDAETFWAGRIPAMRRSARMAA